jgi:hypothetical protein
MNLQYLFDGTLGEFIMEPISLQLMDPNCKPIHARAYTVSRSVEQQLQQKQGNCKIGGHWSPPCLRRLFL